MLLSDFAERSPSFFPEIELRQLDGDLPSIYSRSESETVSKGLMEKSPRASRASLLCCCDYGYNETLHKAENRLFHSILYQKEPLVFSLWNTKEPFLHPSRYQQVTHYLFSPFEPQWIRKCSKHSSRISEQGFETIVANDTSQPKSPN
ncbi:hypothetical protein CEXT_498521 [Caerostris extrusa]|uniref:Uncharacterized protein n=1 Tax=Caerostris extrusa TaxID=172846 RepID=A0AAV4TIF9_CAEEX|nr:hypothetical protein CEXT_498521 [Caerostris extrusa]